jgi:hypothetical protein
MFELAHKHVCADTKVVLSSTCTGTTSEYEEEEYKRQEVKSSTNQNHDSERYACSRCCTNKEGQRTAEKVSAGLDIFII